MIEKILYKYTLIRTELVVIRGIGYFSEEYGDLIEFVYENAKGRGRSHCNRYAHIPIDGEGYYKSSVYLEEDNIEKAIYILLKHQEEMSYNYHRAFIESEQKIMYLKQQLLLAKQESKS